MRRHYDALIFPSLPSANETENTVAADNSCKLARSLLIKFIELMRDLLFDIAASAFDDVLWTVEEI